MGDPTIRRPILAELYEQFLADRDQAAFIHRVAERYHGATLERLVLHSSRWVRRGAVLALGAIADFSSNTVLGHALVDPDRGVRILAETAIRAVWCRDGSWNQQQELARVIGLNAAEKHDAARTAASRLIEDNPRLAESWNQRAIANFAIERFLESVSDCRRTLDLNPFHFGAAAGLGQCHMQLGDHQNALDTFRHALKINPSMEGVRVNVTYLQKLLGKKL
ncbi:MAG TPA: tetratricopeptide repeat protein [Pirellulales bacterium]|jgi:tetratricopeptide (TPR) repeat protein|nr:tetratricopeptide repeat protein [Pirellulales bacterium]